MAYFFDFFGFCVMLSIDGIALLLRTLFILLFYCFIVWAFTSHSIGERSNKLRNHRRG